MPASVLIIDDSESIRDLVSRVLLQGGVADTFLFASDGSEGFKKLLEQPVDLVLCDLLMPGIDGIKFLSMKRARDDLREIPVLILSGEESAEDKVRALEAGGSDYITKPFNEAELVARARVHLQLKQARDLMRVQNAKLEALSRTDPLTGVASRGHLMETFAKELERARRYKQSLGYLMVDIDNFKRVNDRYGHVTGDAVLVAVANAIAKDLRSSDLVGRYGGEEFGILLPHANRDAARLIAERCRVHIANLRVEAGGEKLAVTVSVGATAFPENPAQRIGDLIRAADAALYRAKNGGRNLVIAA